MTADFIPRRRSSDHLDAVILDHGVGRSFSAASFKLASALGSVGPFDLDVEHLALAHARDAVTPSDRNAPSIALPCGSRIPDFSVR